MKYRFVLLIIVFIFLGYFASKLFNEYTSKNNNDYNTYLLQAGVYTSDKILNESTKNLSMYVVDKENGKYYVYVGVTTDKNNKEKLEKFFENKNIDIYSKKTYIGNESFINHLKQYDILLNELTDDKDISRINEVILDSYKELIKT